MTEADNSAPKAGRLATRRVYTGRVVSLDVDSVQFPNGSTGELEMVRHPGASAVVPVLATEDGQTKVLLIKQYRYAADGFVYEIPAGRLERDEDPMACAHRELKEETGYTAGTMTPLTMIFTTPGFTDEKIYLFLASDLSSGDQSLESDEVLDVVPMSMETVLEMIRTGDISDGKSISALLYVATYIK